MSNDNFGQVIQVLGPVVDVEFSSDELPPINSALRLSNQLDGYDTRKLNGFQNENNSSQVEYYKQFIVD